MDVATVRLSIVKRWKLWVEAAVWLIGVAGSKCALTWERRVYSGWLHGRH